MKPKSLGHTLKVFYFCFTQNLLGDYILISRVYGILDSRISFAICDFSNDFKSSNLSKFWFIVKSWRWYETIFGSGIIAEYEIGVLKNSVFGYISIYIHKIWWTRLKMVLTPWPRDFHRVELELDFTKISRYIPNIPWIHNWIRIIQYKITWIHMNMWASVNIKAPPSG